MNQIMELTERGRDRVDLLRFKDGAIVSRVPDEPRTEMIAEVVEVLQADPSVSIVWRDESGEARVPPADLRAAIDAAGLPALHPNY